MVSYEKSRMYPTKKTSCASLARCNLFFWNAFNGMAHTRTDAQEARISFSEHNKRVF